ncbi:MAG: asparagine synthase [Flavobacteriaceae bacterium]|nr:asparagine synthase [Flavobacteriaceae bacterium]|tara:strand:- start:1068 stop:2459 length:1392 start_codon:yes stop_codon:yes gene_type:complete
MKKSLEIRIPIIPKSQTFAKVKGEHVLNYEAICVFTAIGFFLDEDTYYKDEVCLKPGTINTIDESGYLVKSEPWFNWHYSPRDISFEDALNEFSELFESIIDQQVGDKKVILPLSGGLDSRTQAVALNHLDKNVEAYSYSFENGYNEAKISKQIADACNFSFEAFKITKGYLWENIEELSKINGCYAEFTHARQMAIIDSLKSKGDIFSLGHWGDVLFDSTTNKQLSVDDEVNLILKKIIKPGGLQLAKALWESWSLEGDFELYLRDRVKNLLSHINIENSSAKIRAFKSMYWAPRWTTANLSVFESVHPIKLPYYDNEMCKFICTIPEDYLADRKLQIAYIKKRNKKLSKIVWQEQKPFNLNNFHFNKSPYNLPYRISNKLYRTLKNIVGKNYVQRNWELQFLGEENAKNLEKYIFNEDFYELVSKQIIENFYDGFKEVDNVKFSHPLSMLLTLSLWQKNNS